MFSGYVFVSISVGWESLSFASFPSLSFSDVIAAIFFIVFSVSSSSKTIHATCNTLLSGSFLLESKAFIKFSILPSLYWSLFDFILTFPFITSTLSRDVTSTKSVFDKFLLAFSIVFNLTICGNSPFATFQLLL